MFKTYPKSRQVIALYDAIPRPGELHLTAYLWGNGQGEKADYERLAKYCPILAKAAEAKRVGDRALFLELYCKNEAVKEVWHDELDNLLKNLFGDSAKLVTTGRGEFPPAPKQKGEIKGSACTWHKRGNESRVVVSPYYVRDFRANPKDAHYRRVRVCNQIVAEADYNKLLKLEATKEDTKKLINRIKKANTRGEFCRYLALPQEGGEFVIIHNRQKEGGECLKTLTNDYDKATLYELVTSWSNTPEGTRVQSSEGFGRMFQGMQGDGRAKIAAKLGKPVKPKTFQAQSLVSPQDIASILGLSLNDQLKGELTTSNHEAPLNELEKKKAIAPLNSKDRERFNAYISQFGEMSLLKSTSLPLLGVLLSSDKTPLEDTEEQLQLLFSGKKLPAGGSYE